MITVILSAVVLTFLLNPIVKLLEKRGIKRWISILIVYLFLFLLLFCIVYLAIPPLAQSVINFANNLPAFYQSLLTKLKQTFGEGLLRNMPLDLQGMMDEKFGELTGFISQAGSILLGQISNISSFLLDLTLGIILAYYLLVDLNKVKGGVIEFLPEKVREPVKELAVEIYRIFMEFLKGQGALAVSIGAISFVALLCLNVKFALFLGIIAGITELIPYIGPIIGAIPAVLFAFGDSPIKAIWVIVIYVVIQQISGGVLAPKLVGERIGLHPITTILAIAIGGKWFGVLGMIFAAPVFAAFKAIVLKIIKAYT